MRMMLRGRRRSRSDAGFTLIELTLSVSILGIVSAALVGVVLQYLQTTRDTSARLNESTDQQFVSTYWQNDVSSLGRQTLSASSVLTPHQSVFVGSAGPAGCGTSVGTVVVAFAWNEFSVDAPNPANAWNATPHEVAYVTIPSGGRLVLKRVRCRGGAADQPQTVAHNITTSPAIGCDTACAATPPPNRVSMTFTVKDATNADSQGYTVTLSADRRQG